ncbi:MAG: glycine oxidase ThiO [Myxococcota bacterium]
MLDGTLEYDVAIVGAGVVGLGVGWRLASAGLSVGVFERDEAGSGASSAAAGMLAPTAEVEFEEEDLLRLGRRSLERYPEFVAEVEQVSGEDVDYRTEGTLVVGLDRDDTEALARLYDYHMELGLDVVRLSADAAREREPALSPNIHSALFIPGDHQVDALVLTRALSSCLESAGGEIHEHTPVAEVRIHGERVQGLVLEDGRQVDADTVLLAAGAWTRQLGGLPDDVMPHIRPVRGQMLALDLGDPPLCEHVIRAPDAYLVPKSNGSLVVGATSEEMGFDPRLTAGGIFELLRGAWETMPGVYDLHFLDMWTGFRPVALDNKPRLGPTPIEGLWLGAGHGRNGILLAATTAFDLAASIERGELVEALEAFAPGTRAR